MPQMQPPSKQEAERFVFEVRLTKPSEIRFNVGHANRRGQGWENKNIKSTLAPCHTCGKEQTLHEHMTKGIKPGFRHNVKGYLQEDGVLYLDTRTAEDDIGVACSKACAVLQEL